MSSEATNAVNRIILALGKITTIRIFRNNTGSTWAGRSRRFTKREQIWVNAGDVLIEDARFFVAGLCVGGSDTIGIKSTTITAEMVGTVIGQFVAVEVKTGSGRPTKEQLNFIAMVNKMGGRAFVARSEAEAIELINKPTSK